VKNTKEGDPKGGDNLLKTKGYQDRDCVEGSNGLVTFSVTCHATIIGLGSRQYANRVDHKGEDTIICKTYLLVAVIDDRRFARNENEQKRNAELLQWNLDLCSGS
jgi:hypothetical protein